MKTSKEEYCATQKRIIFLLNRDTEIFIEFAHFKYFNTDSGRKVLWILRGISTVLLHQKRIWIVRIRLFISLGQCNRQQSVSIATVEWIQADPTMEVDSGLPYKREFDRKSKKIFEIIFAINFVSIYAWVECLSAERFITIEYLVWLNLSSSSSFSFYVPRAPNHLNTHKTKYNAQCLPNTESIKSTKKKKKMRAI